MYDKQLDSGKGTLLHLCDDVIQQEVRASLMHFVSTCFFFFFFGYFSKKLVVMIFVSAFRIVFKIG